VTDGLPEARRQRAVISTKPGSTAIIAQRIAAERVDDFLKWQAGISETTSGFPGYVGTDLYPAVQGVQDDWVTIVHFESNDQLDVWLKSDARAEWSKRFHEEFGDFDLRRVAGSLGFWFSSQGPADWKMVLTVILGLTPAVVLVSAYVMPFISAWPMAARVLVGNTITVSLLQWMIMPLLAKWLAWWHYPKRDGSEHATAFKGAVLALSLLSLMTFLFSRIYG
jgi:uncharacterized protein